MRERARCAYPEGDHHVRDPDDSRRRRRLRADRDCDEGGRRRGRQGGARGRRRAPSPVTPIPFSGIEEVSALMADIIASLDEWEYTWHAAQGDTCAFTA